MAKIIHKIDPAADTVIILKNPLAFFAVWSQGGVDALVPAQCAFSAPPEDSTVDAVEQSATGEPVVDAVEPSAAAEPTVSTAEGPVSEEFVGPAAPTVDNTVEPDLSEHSANEEEIYYYVSSRHLRLVSPKFDRMLIEGKWKEGVPDENDGRYHISAEDWDKEALLLLLNVLHHRNRQVPRSLSLEMLAKIAVLIDYYDCAEAVELCTERWIEDLRKTSMVPSVFCRDLMLWMCVAWVLKLSTEFTKTTAVAFSRVDQGLPTLGLPIISCVDKMNQERLRAIDTVLSRLQDLLNGYSNPTYQCPKAVDFDDLSFECGSILYGALSKQMKLAGLLIDSSNESYRGLGFWETCSKLKEIKSPVWYDLQGFKIKNKPLPDPHPCNLGDRVKEIIAEVNYLVNGFHLRDFGRV